MKTGSLADVTAYVLDTFALMAYLRDEPGALRVQSLIRDAGSEQCSLFVSLINLAEICTLTERRGGAPRVQEVLALIRQLPIEVIPVDEQTVFAAAHLKAHYRLSFADAFAVTSAQGLNGVLVTGDLELAPVEKIVQVERLEKRKKKV